MTLRAAHRISHRLLFDFAYTWSKSIDDASDTGTTNAEYNLPEDQYAMNLEKALSSFNHPQRFTANAVYDLPFGKHRSNWFDRAIGGWRVSEIFTAQSGSPFTVNLSAAGQNVSPTGMVSGNHLERPNLIGNPNAGPETPLEWFNTVAFVLPARGTFGTAGLNVVTGPGLIDLDVSLQEGSNSPRAAETANSA